VIIFIEGLLMECAPLRVVLNVNAIGYEVHIPLVTAEKMPPIGEKVKLHTLVIYREDAQTLYGFHQPALRDFFRLIVEKVSGIGPKTALMLLSRLSLATLETAIRAADVHLLSQCPGIGKKTAERLIMELKDKLGASPSSLTLPSLAQPNLQATRDQDALAALISLGFKPADADKALRQAIEKVGAQAPVEVILRTALSPSPQKS